PEQPVPALPTRANGISRRTTLTLIGGGAVAAIAAAVGIPALTKDHASGRSPASSSPPTSLQRPSNEQEVLAFTGLAGPMDVAVDSLGNVYVSDFGNNRVVKLAAGSSTQTVLSFNNLNQPRGVAVDNYGNVYVADDQNGRVVK